MMRLDKFLTECGVGTRSEVKKYMDENGKYIILLEKEQEKKELVENGN